MRTAALVLASLLVASGCGGGAPANTPTATTTPVDGGTSTEAGLPNPSGAGVDAGTGIVPGGVRFLGRVDVSDPSAPRFAWSGSGFVATVSGTTISVSLKSEGSDAFFQPVVDGTPGARFSVAKDTTSTVTLGKGLAAGDHTVEVYRETEGMYGDSVFLGFVDGTLKGAPPSNGRLVEVVGDSISAGYGNLGNEVHPPWDNSCTFSLDTESAYASYAFVLGRALDAEVSVVARSGWGMYRDLAGNTANVVPSVYDRAAGTDLATKWDFARKPAAVVVNLGTNDSAQGDPGQPYEDAYVAFVKTVRGRYPGAWVFLTLGTMTSDPLLTTMRTHLANVVSALGDAKVRTIDLAAQDTTSTGCDYHPNVVEDQRMASALAPVLRAQLSW